MAVRLSCQLFAFGSTRALTRAGKEKAETRPREESRERNRPLRVLVSERKRAEIETYNQNRKNYAKFLSKCVIYNCMVDYFLEKYTNSK